MPAPWAEFSVLSSQFSITGAGRRGGFIEVWWPRLGRGISDFEFIGAGEFAGSIGVFCPRLGVMAEGCAEFRK